MKRTALTLLAASLAISLATSGCKKDDDDDEDTSVDTNADTPSDTAGDTATDTLTDVPDDTPAETVEDTAGDTPAETVEDTTGDTPAETVEDTTGDTSTDTVDEDGSAACDTDLGTWTPGATEAGVAIAYDWWAIDGSISADLTTEPVSVLEIESYDGPMAVGTTTITSFVDYATCTLCITVYEGCTSSGCTRLYMAEQATLELTTFDFSVGGSLAGSATGLYLTEYDDSTDTLVSGGVSMCVDVWAFDETFVDWS